MFYCISYLIIRILLEKLISEIDGLLMNPYKYIKTLKILIIGENKVFLILPIIFQLLFSLIFHQFPIPYITIYSNSSTINVILLSTKSKHNQKRISIFSSNLFTISISIEKGKHTSLFFVSWIRLNPNTLLATRCHAIARRIVLFEPLKAERRRRRRRGRESRGTGKTNGKQ